MRRRIWLIAIVAALFGLQVPLCAVACLTSTDAQRVALDETEQPCHADAPGPSPAGEPASREDCGCEFAPEAFVRQLETTTTPAQLFVLRAPVWQPTAVPVSWEPRVVQSTDLPPPDVLLRKSTLIV